MVEHCLFEAGFSVGVSELFTNCFMTPTASPLELPPAKGSRVIAAWRPTLKFFTTTF